MSTRWYPLYQKGNPQLRVFLPNFWIKVVKPTVPQPPNVILLHCSMEMTKHDIRNYLEKVYDIKTVDVRTRINMGKTKKLYPMGYIVKEDDVKVAYAVLPKDQSFVFPTLVNKEKLAEDKKLDQESLEEMKGGQKDFLKANNKPGIPGWFSI